MEIPMCAVPVAPLLSVAASVTTCAPRFKVDVCSEAPVPRAPSGDDVQATGAPGRDPTSASAGARVNATGVPSTNEAPSAGEEMDGTGGWLVPAATTVIEMDAYAERPCRSVAVKRISCVPRDGEGMLTVAPEPSAPSSE